MHRHSTATLMGLTKEELVEYVRMAEHNQEVAEEALNQQTENVKDWQPCIHGHWEDISETEIPLPGMMTPITNTVETCSVCKVSVGFVGPKKYLFDNRCPNCGAFMDEIV